MRSTLVAFAVMVCLSGGSAEAAPILQGQVVQTTYLLPNMVTVFTGPTNTTV